MPTLNAYVSRSGLYIRGRVGTAWATWQMGERGEKWMKSSGFRPGDSLDIQTITDLLDRGLIWTYGSGAGTEDIETLTDGRDRQAWAREQLERLYPTAAARRRACRCIARTIRTAHRINSGVWSISLFEAGHTRVRVNVGVMEVLTLESDCTLRLLVHRPLIEELERQFPLSVRLESPRAYRARPRAICVRMAPRRIAEWYPKLWPAHKHLVSSLAYTYEGAPFAGSHSPGLLKYLRSLGFDAPNAIH